MRCIVIFFDTNVLVYAVINQDEEKMKLSQTLIANAIENDTFFISTLVLSEYIFILSKLKIIDEQHRQLMFFSSFAVDNHSTPCLLEGYALCRKLDFCKNINDAIHLKVAEKYCTKLVTFDSDYKKMQPYTTIEVEIL
ncbi:MAG: Unknown protein [uncultured Sulfurovum sp.]|uniref:Ribonuclease VapC n=1 Tax=uncultured Sulfurovum sp. TaxID=269237 RepID=A0A6S6SR04_9BACT|nr:MAG: Unknown protein [uncultured Sulfurovum sp.]